MRIIYDNDIKILIPKSNLKLNEILDLISNEINPKSNQHYIIDISSINDVEIKDILLFLNLSKTLKDNGISFVIITKKIDLNIVPEELVIVPTLTEAKDIIEMEKIERDLGF